MKSNSTMVPEAKEAMERFKQQSASEVGVSLKLLRWLDSAGR